MVLLIRNAIIVHPESKFNGKKRDVLIKNGKIESIKSKIEPPSSKAKVLEAKGAYLSVGWLDVGVQVGDPGYEHRETLQTATAAAAAGGFTGIACQPNSLPVTHSKSEILYLKRAQMGAVDFFPIGAISQNCGGEDITEMYDMHEAGAVAFSDGKKPLQNGGLMMRALQYVKAFDGLIMNHPDDHSLSAEAQMHEGGISTSLGMRGIPSIAEELMLQRDIYLLEYTESRLHVANVSTRGAVELLRKAKAKGLNITASVAVMNLVASDAALSHFDTNYKVLPPLREKEDIEALLEGLKDGTIDFVCSNHIPWEKEAKHLEFPYAEFGAIGMETLYALCNTHLGDQLSHEDIVRLLAIRSREILRLPTPQIAEGAIANLTLFHPKQKWIYQEKDIRSRSKNSPFIDQEFVGKVLAVVNNEMVHLNP